MREEATCARAHSIKSSCSPAMRQKTAANVPRWQSEPYLVHRRESFHGVFTEESAKWPSVRSSRHQEEAGRGWASVAYANNVQSVGDGVGRTSRVSKLGFTDLIFMDLGVKVNGSYYRVVLLSQKLLRVLYLSAGQCNLCQFRIVVFHKVVSQHI